MIFIDLKELEYYIGCNQNDEFYYSTIDCKIYNIESIISDLSIDKKDFVENCFYYDYIPLPILDIANGFDGFINSLNDKRTLKYFSDVNKRDPLEYWLKFNAMFHTGFEKRLWDEYYDNYVHEKAINWCVDYNVSYRK